MPVSTGCAPAPARARDCRRWRLRWARYSRTAVPGTPCVPDLPITGVTLRAQDVQPGDLFAALPGSTTHGARYAGDAIERGAVAVLTDAAGVAEMGAVVRHRADAGAPGPAQRARRPGRHGVRKPVRPAGGASGSPGRRARRPRPIWSSPACAPRGRTAGLIGTIGIRIDGADIPSALTTPEAPALQAMLAAMAERGVDTVVMEVSSHALTLGRVDGTRLRGRRLHQPVPRPPRLSPDHGRLLRGQGAAVRPGLAAARPYGRGVHRRRRRARDGRPGR